MTAAQPGQRRRIGRKFRGKYLLGECLARNKLRSRCGAKAVQQISARDPSMHSEVAVTAFHHVIII
jgi:hypothetical protein